MGQPDEEASPGGGASPGGEGSPTGQASPGNATDGGGSVADLDGEVGQTPEYLQIDEHSAYESGDDVGVIGVVRNVGPRPLENVEVEVTLRDGDTVLGEFVDTSEQEIELLRPGNAWRFQVVFEDENLSRATGYTIAAEADVAREADA